MATTSVTIRVDENLKKKAECLFDEIGMNMTTAFTIFMKTAIRHNGIPFPLEINPFYSETNQARLRRAAKDMDAGKWTAHDIIEVGDDD